MAANLVNPKTRKCFAIAVTDLSRSGSTADWVTVDVSGIFQAEDILTVLAQPTKVGGDFVGARELGSAVASQQGVGQNFWVVFRVQVNPAGRIQLFDSSTAAPNNYYVDSYER